MGSISLNNSLKILLVEDEEHLAFALEFNLSQEGYSVDVATTVAQARLLSKKLHDLIVLDVMLPDGNGISFCKELRENAINSPILMLTAKGQTDDIIAGLEAGADDYLTKPFELKVLLSRIRALLRRGPWQLDLKSKNKIVQFGETTINFDAHLVEHQGRPIEITALELRLLDYFIANEGRVLSRETLLTHVWEVHPSSQTRTVDNFIVRLRRLFEKDPSKPEHFLTVRGAGYKFSR